MREDGPSPTVCPPSARNDLLDGHEMDGEVQQHQGQRYNRGGFRSSAQTYNPS